MKVFTQKTTFDCGPACVKMAFDARGIKTSYYKVKKLCKLTPNGCTTGDLITALQQAGLKTHTQEHTSIKDLKRNLDNGCIIITEWFSINTSHYSIITCVNNDILTLADPWYKKKRNINFNDFLKVWFGFDNEILKIRPIIIIESKNE